ncbi:MAG: nucleotidyltransferase domain-containing protein [Candidatus Aenigmarchaeota archaeon]|nr:nucleotidyltransferase domain-containing protein [Candidatus Aenigmarchaeota archaeon]
MSKKIDAMTLLDPFLAEPNRTFNVREMARLTRLNPTTCSRYLTSLRKQGFLVRKKERNLILYAADTESHAYRDFKIYRNIRRIRASGLLQHLEDALNYPEAVILFGSYAKGENAARSDIDLFILSESGKRLDLDAFERKLGASIQVFMHTRQELEILKVKNKELLNNILNGIVLLGFVEVFR